MIFRKSPAIAAILISLGISACGEPEQLQVVAAGSDAVSGISPAAPQTDSADDNDGVGQPGATLPGDSVTPSAEPQTGTPPPAGTAPPSDTDAADPGQTDSTQTTSGQPDSDLGQSADSGTSTSNPPAEPPPSPTSEPPTPPTSEPPATEPDTPPAAAEPEPEPQVDAWWMPKASENLKWQWQLQGEIDTSLPVQVYNIDIDAPQDKLDELKARDIKVICYFSAGTVESFRSDSRLFAQEIIGEQYEDLIDERWVDYANIDALAPIMRARMDKCKSKGFDAIEIDNVDAHNFETRDAQGEVTNIGTNFNMTLDESIAYVRWLTAEAHSRGLGIGLKNAEEMVADVVDEVDWMLVEDCYFDSWCMAATAFIDADKPVFMAEYDELVPDFTPACELAKSLGYTAIWRDTSLATELYLACE